MLARNFACISLGINFWVGFACISTPPYRDGAVAQIQGTVRDVSVNYPSPYGILAAFFLMCGSVGMAAFERWTWMQPLEQVRVDPWTFNLRIVAYALLSLPGFFVAFGDDHPLMPPFIGSICFAATALLFGLSRGAEPPNPKDWQWDWFKDDTRKTQKAVQLGGNSRSSDGGPFSTVRRIVVEAFERNVLGRTVFLLLYTTLNVVLWIEAAYRHGQSNLGRMLRGEEFWLCQEPLGPCCGSGKCGEAATATRFGPLPILLPGSDPRSQTQSQSGIGAGTWYPIAKGFGQLLNLNCAVMLLPVIRTAVMKVHDATSLRSKGAHSSWLDILLANLPALVPVDKNVVFHKACAKYFIFASVFGHAAAHYFNYAYAPFYHGALAANGLDGKYGEQPFEMAWHPRATGSRFLGAGFTGNLLVLTMVTIFAGAHDTVKRRHYETFWFTHHFFLAWFVLLLLHGPVFWQWALWSVFPYLADRFVYRVFYRGGQRFVL